MVYDAAVFKIFITQILLILAAFGLFFLTYYLIRQSPQTRSYTYLTFFFLFLGFYGMWIYRDSFIDVVRYIQYGDTYIAQTQCTVKSVTGAQAGRLLLGLKYITCWEDSQGRSFQLWFHRKPFFPKQDQTYLFIHLPRSRQILEIRTPDDQERVWPSTDTNSGMWSLLSLILLFLFWRVLVWRRPRIASSTNKRG